MSKSRHGSVPQFLRTALAEKYLLERELGAGGMATVYLARDVKHDRSVAIKVLHAELANAVGAERFLREIGITARLQHPHILPLLDSGEARDTVTGERYVYYVMPLVSGESLREHLMREGALSATTAQRMLREVVDAVAYAHRLGIIHRDIKPDNIMLTGPHAVVVDFGIAKAMGAAREGERLTATGISLGTPTYMAPEQALAEPTSDHRADIYAIGAVAYEMLTGTPPFRGPTAAVLAAQLTTSPTPPRAANPNVSPQLERIVLRCLERDPGARYQTADELLQAIESLTVPVSNEIAAQPRRRYTVLTGAALIVAVLLAVGIALLQRPQWVRAEAIADITRLVDAGDPDSAFALVEHALKVAPDDTMLLAEVPSVAQRLAFTTFPPGATVQRAPFEDTTHWREVGVTPTGPVRVPFAVQRYRISKPGFRTVMLLTGGIPDVTSPAVPDTIRLDSVDAPHKEMTRVPAGLADGSLNQLRALQPLPLADYLIDRLEVTNAEYKAFVDAGGYAKREYWNGVFDSAGLRLTWEKAIARFTDRTGRAGPSTWEGGDIPRGQHDVPVGGVSWYEAAVYAKYAGKELPTLYHWTRAAGVITGALVVPGSNFDSQAPVRGGAFLSMGPWGVFDMGGNMREWCFNDDGSGKAYILGGGWTDPTFRFTSAYALDRFDRSPANGIRLVKYLAPIAPAAIGPIVRSTRDYRKEKPASDAVSATYVSQYDYDASPLNARVDARDTTAQDWILEHVSFDAVYGNERVSADVYLPKRHAPPFQTIVYYPAGNAFLQRTRGDQFLSQLYFLMASGRALVLPILKGTYNRGGGPTNGQPNETIAYRDHVAMWGKDVRRTVDYLVTRPDVDSTRIALIGLSWGGRMAPLMLAIEPRFKVAIMYVGGLSMEKARPEADPFHFVSRVKVPTLMLGGKHDHVFPVETAQRPLFDLLGTPPDRKRHALFDGGHFIPREQMIAETLNWLDRYLGATSKAK